MNLSTSPRILGRIVRAGWLAGALLLPCSGISISVYLAAPNVVSSPVTGGTVASENFSSNPNWAQGLHTSDRVRGIGTFDLSPQSALRIQNSDQYGGAGNNGRYAAFGAQSGTAGAITLNLANPTSYFGMWWSAIDPYNGVSLYDGNTLLMRIGGSDVISLMGVATLTAQNGTQYSRTAYMGKPGTSPRQNTGEYYAYVMFHASGVTFNRVVFDNSGTTATGFEMDNFETRTGSFLLPGSTVLLTQQQITAVPEPGAWLPACAGLAACIWWRRRRRAAGRQ